MRRLAPKMQFATALVLSCALGVVFGQTVPQSLFSSSKQFVVYCDDAKVRSAVASFAEQVKTDVITLLGLASPWKYPIIVQIKPQGVAEAAAPLSKIQIYETDLGFKVQLDVLVGEDPAKAELRKHLVRAVLMEIVLRENPAAAKTAIFGEPPDWLVEGIITWADFRQTGVDPEVFRILVGAARLPSLAEFLVQKDVPADSASRSVFRACSFALTKLLLELPDGHNALLQWLKNPHSPADDPAGVLGTFFHELSGDPKKREKWWALSLVRLSKSGEYSGLGFDETVRRLDALLVVKIAADEGEGAQDYPIGEYRTYLKLKKSGAALSELERQLMELGANSSPLLRSVISDYQQIAGLLARGKTQGMAKRLEQVAQERQNVGARLQKIADYMNWFEATQMQTLSGAFKDYLREARNPDKDSSRRSDPVSRYMDILVPEFE